MKRIIERNNLLLLSNLMNTPQVSFLSSGGLYLKVITIQNIQFVNGLDLASINLI